MPYVNAVRGSQGGRKMDRGGGVMAREHRGLLPHLPEERSQATGALRGDFRVHARQELAWKPEALAVQKLGG